MKDTLIDFYINKKQPEIVDLSLISNVNSDNVIETLNKIYNFDWSYEVTEIKEIAGMVHATIVLYTPGRIFTSVACSNEKVDNLVELALAKATVNMYKTFETIRDTSDITDQEINEEEPTEEIENKTIENVTLEELQEEEETKKASTAHTTNPYGIRNDQIDFMNNFKKTHNIDSDEKFNYYIKTWSDNTGREIHTNKQLITYCVIEVDAFIKWVHMIVMNSNPAFEISSPI